MEYKSWYKLFNDYAKRYDLKEKWIMYKFHHTYRVLEYAKEIALSLSLKKEDMDLVVLASLLHDIARFKQYTEYKTFSDQKSFDHGDEGVKILKENDFVKKFIDKEEDIRIVLSSIKNHNKFKIEELDDRALLISKIVRDADKLDIITDLANTITDDNYELDDNLVQAIIECKEIDKPKEFTCVTEILFYITFVYDLNFKYSIQILKDKKTIENKFDLLKIYIDDKRIEEMKKSFDNYVKERLEC